MARSPAKLKPLTKTEQRQLAKLVERNGGFQPTTEGLLSVANKVVKANKTFDEALTSSLGSVEGTLAERGNRYGDFSDHARCAQRIQDAMRYHQRPSTWADGDFILPWDCVLNDVQRQALTVIADKIARILNGDPNYADNWHDIQGYAKLVEDRLK